MKRLNPKAQRELIRFLKFCVVGVIGAVVDFGTFNLLANALHVWSVGASMASFTAAVCSNFLWNRYWTCPDSRSKQLGAQLMQFTLVSLAGLAIRTPIFALTEQPLIRWSAGFLPGLQANLAIQATWLSGLQPTWLGRNLALAMAVIVVLFWNFGVNRVWTYSDVS